MPHGAVSWWLGHHVERGIPLYVKRLSDWPAVFSLPALVIVTLQY